MALKRYLYKDLLEAGCDEAGRGCLAGPVFAAAVILPPGFKNNAINDSKALTPEVREELRSVIMEKSFAWGVGFADHVEVDRYNILRASFMAMHRALDQLKASPQMILVDGNRFPGYRDIPHTCIVGGDAKFLAIAAASILAKSFRDEYMLRLHEEFSCYGWSKNKGYATSDHRAAIQENGPSVYHRKSFLRNILPSPGFEFE
jgi:ribonuclease HII